MRTMKKGFTLLELLTVVAIMALLGAASTGGYSAMQRGIRERGAVSSAAALMRAAKERAAVDRVPTAVYCYNRMLRDADADSDENAIVVGVMTAVRRSGRMTYVRNQLLFDEFSDINLTYPCFSDEAHYSTDGQSHNMSELDEKSAIRLYKFPTSSSTMEYSLVADTVWCTDANDVHLFSGAARNGDTNCLMSAFYKKAGSKHEASWAVGDAYAFEIGEIQLPHGMTFEKDIPSDAASISNPRVFVFYPEDDSNNTIDIYTTRPGASGRPEKFLKAGTASSDENQRN